jgi:aspartyl-tRNA(Asn)/glutamyl-tRNA(Gln) amidotransferase subunit A
LIGTYVLSAGYYDAYYLKSQKDRTLIKRDIDLAWDQVDCVLTPTTPNPAFGFGEKSGDPLAMYLEDIFTVTVNMAGLPGISVPAGLSSEGTPIGLQLIGKPFDEATLFRAAQVIEDAAGHFPVPTKWWA